MSSDLVLRLIIMLILLAMSAFFSGAETALTTVSQIKMKTMAKDGDSRAERVLKVLEKKDKMLSAILIGNNIVNLSASSLATTVATKLLGSVGAGIATGILTFLILIFGEITPKSRAQVHNVDLSLKYAGIIYVLMQVLTPIIFVINKISGGILRLIDGNKGEDGQKMTEEELRTIVDESKEEGVILTNEQKYIHNLFDFSDATAKEVMIPRIDVTMVNVNWSYEKLMDLIREEMLTRMPVYEGDKDHVIGIINVKDLLLKKDGDFHIRDYLREAYFTYEQKNTLELFQEMRKNSISMAIVLDEYGAVAGLITMEDLLEELVGEIRDEYDSDEEDDIVVLSDREFLVQGSMNLEDLCKVLPLNFESDDYDTLGGYLTGLFDHVPEVGETYVTKEGILLRVVATGHQRIEKVRIRFPKAVKIE
ncbi:MAG: hemolysin family protein [Lachnospiraceae bacterium]|nr:hemolysin family protein [Lachnospiraceae bacterium]